MRKKLTALVLACALLCPFAPLAFAQEGDGVAARLANVQEMSGYTVGTAEYNCYLFAGRVFRMLFEYDSAPNINYHGDYDSNNHNTMLIARMYTPMSCSIISCGGRDPVSDEAKALTLGEVTIENTRTLLSMAMPGDILQGHRGDGVHTMVVQHVNYEGDTPVSVTVYHGNWNSQVTISTFSVETLVSTYDHALSDFRSLNYYLIDSGSSVYFNPEGGDASFLSKFVNGGQPIGSLPTASRAGYAFEGWYTARSGGSRVDETTVPTELSMHLYAHWTPVSYTVSFDPAGGSCGTAGKSVYYGGTYGSLPTAEREGYTLAGWAVRPSGAELLSRDSAVSVNHDHTLYAVWEPKTYTVELDPGEGELEQTSAEVAFGQSYGALPAPVLEGYMFAGWSDGTRLLSADDPVATAQDHALTAVYLPQFTDVVTGLTAGSDATDSITLRWDQTPDATGYEIYRAVGAQDTPTLLATLEGAGTLSYTDGGLQEGDTFVYTVRAFQRSAEGIVQYSPRGTAVEAATYMAVPQTPEKFRAAAPAATYVTLSWNPVENATGYELQRAESPDGEFVTIYATPNNTTTNTACVPDTTYYYRVVAVRTLSGTIARSAPTETVEVTTLPE